MPGCAELRGRDRARPGRPAGAGARVHRRPVVDPTRSAILARARGFGVDRPVRHDPADDCARRRRAGRSRTTPALMPHTTATEVDQLLRARAELTAVVALARPAAAPCRCARWTRRAGGPRRRRRAVSTRSMTGRTARDSISGQTACTVSATIAAFWCERPAAQPGGMDGGALGQQRAEVEFALASALQAEHDQPAADRQRSDVARQVQRHPCCRGRHRRRAARSRRRIRSSKTSLAVVDRDVGAEFAAERRPCAGVPAVAKTRAPRWCASWIAIVPMPLVPPCTRRRLAGLQPPEPRAEHHRPDGAGRLGQRRRIHERDAGRDGHAAGRPARRPARRSRRRRAGRTPRPRPASRSPPSPSAAIVPEHSMPEVRRRAGRRRVVALRAAAGRRG